MSEGASTRPAIWVGLVGFMAAVAAQVLSHRHDAVFGFWDAQAHLDIARRVFDATTPGLQMLGTVWLPIPHLLYLPFTMIDQLWWNGLAGGIVGGAAFVLTVVSVHDIAHRRLGVAGGWVAALLVIINPSLLYLQSTAMTEPLLLGFMTASVALIDRWWEAPERGDSTLWWAGIMAALAVGSRYDGWFLVAIAVPMILWRSRSLLATLRFALPPLVMVVLWLWYNWHYFGDPLEFQRGAWSAAAQQAALAEQGLLPTRGKLALATWYYLGAVGLTAGWVLLVAAVPGAYFAFRRRAGAALVLLGSALAFNIIALVAGQSVIALPWTTPAGLLNLRYGVMLLPALALAVAAVLVAVNQKRIGWVGFALVAGLQLAGWSMRFPEQVGALREGLAIRDGDRAQMDVSIWLEHNYDRGRVLISPALNVSPRTRIAMRDRVYPWSWEVGPAALDHPASVVDWVVVDQRNQSDPVTVAVAADSSFGRDFLLAHENHGITIWQRR